MAGPLAQIRCPHYKPKRRANILELSLSSSCFWTEKLAQLFGHLRLDRRTHGAQQEAQRHRQMQLVLADGEMPGHARTLESQDIAVPLSVQAETLRERGHHAIGRLAR